MRRDLGPDVLFNLVMMMRARSQKSVLLTESDLDTDFYRRFVSEAHCLVRSAATRNGVLTNLERFASYSVKGCVGIIDADCDFVLRRLRPRPDVFLTDNTDKETSAIASPAFDDFCLDLGAAIPSVALRSLLFEAAFPLGAIRRVSVREGLRLDFRAVEVSDFIGDNVECNLLTCCEAVLAINQDLELSVETLMEFARDRICLSLPRGHVVRGHDLIAILEHRSKYIFGRRVSRWDLERALARAYTESHFQLSQTYADLRACEGTMLQPFRLFT